MDGRLLSALHLLSVGCLWLITEHVQESDQRIVLKLREKITAGDHSGDPSARDEDCSLGVGEIAGERCIK